MGKKKNSSKRTRPKTYQPETSFTTMQRELSIIRRTLKYCVAYIRPISCPLNEFLLTPENSWKLHPLGIRKRSSFKIANAFAISRQPSSSVHKPISYINNELVITYAQL